MSTADAASTSITRIPPAAAAAEVSRHRAATQIAEEQRDVLLHGLSWSATGGELGGPYVDSLRQAVRDLSAGRPSRLTPKALLDGLLFEIGNARDRGEYPFPKGTETALRTLFSSHDELLMQLDGYFARRAAAKCQDVLPPSTTRWFEYHCYEGHDSGDAPAWYRSHETVTVTTVINYEPTLHDGTTFAERAEDCCQLVYRVHWSDGFAWDVFEDELLESPSHFCRPDPPVDPTGRHLKPAAHALQPESEPRQSGSAS